MLPEGISLRPRTAADDEFLFALYASTREDELKQTDWSDEQKRAFCRQQFEAQCAHYDRHYPGASFDLIEREGAPVGRLYVHRGARDIRIMDIALVPAARGAGIGTRLLRMILEEGARTGKKVSIHVEQFSPALRLYQRLGFVPIEVGGAYFLLEWSQPKIAS
jgi:GNAT superfamily N-acetyltransferase